MLAEVLQTFAEDFAAEYDENRIPAMFDEAISILNGRAAQGVSGYATQIHSIREKCERIILTSRFNDYPTAWLNEIEGSGFAPYLPARAAQMILNSLPTDFNIAPPSPPFALYKNAAMQARTEIEGYRSFSRRFAIPRIVLPEGKSGVIVAMPKVVFGKNVKRYGDTIERFSNVATCIAEIIKGERIEPELLYTSSSDLIATLLVYKELVGPYFEAYEAIVATILFIKGAKEAAEKFHKFLGPKEEPNIRAELAQRLEPTLNSMFWASPERKHPLSAKLVSAAADLIEPIQHGARASVAVSAKDEPTITFKKLDGSAESLRDRMRAIRELEADIPVTVPELPKEEPAPALLTHQPPEDEE